LVFDTVPAVHASGVATQASTLIETFKSLCADGDPSPLHVFALADAEGWRRDGEGAPKDFEQTTDRFRVEGDRTLILRVIQSPNHGEEVETCGVSEDAPVAGLVNAMQTSLGFAPKISFGQSATFFALHTQEGWQDGGHLDQPGFLQAKAQGRFVSFAVLGGTDASTILAVRARPLDLAPPRP
jgi:hypothetical protein